MVATLFGRQDFFGQALDIDRDIQNLGTTRIGHRASSLRMTEPTDRILLFQRRNWLGRAICRRGPHEITNLGREEEGGKRGLNNRISAVRFTEFRIRIRYHIIQSSTGAWPDGIADEAAMESYIAQIHERANSIWSSGFLQFTDIGHSVHVNDDYFDLDGGYADLREERTFQTTEQVMHAFLVNSANLLGAAVRRDDSRRFFCTVRSGAIPAAGRTLAHEIGHSLGLGHGANTDPNLLMSQTAVGSGTNITDDQVETVHEGLADRRGPDRLFRRE